MHLDSIASIEQDIVIREIQTLVLNTFAAFETGSQLKWNDAELAVYLVYIFGDINKCKRNKLSLRYVSVLIGPLY